MAPASTAEEHQHAAAAAAAAAMSASVNSLPALLQQQLLPLLNCGSADSSPFHNASFQLWPSPGAGEETLLGADCGTKLDRNGCPVSKRPKLELNLNNMSNSMANSPNSPLEGSNGDLRRRIDSIQSLADCKQLLHSIVDMLHSPTQLHQPTGPLSHCFPQLPQLSPLTPISHSFPAGMISHQNFDPSRALPVSVSVNKELEGEIHYDLHTLYEQFWACKSHLSPKNIPSAFTRFVLNRVLGKDISKVGGGCF